MWDTAATNPPAGMPDACNMHAFAGSVCLVAGASQQQHDAKFWCFNLCIMDPWMMHSAAEHTAGSAAGQRSSPAMAHGPLVATAVVLSVTAVPFCPAAGEYRSSATASKLLDLGKDAGRAAKNVGPHCCCWVSAFCWMPAVLDWCCGAAAAHVVL
jgi:hypothetical protein